MYEVKPRQSTQLRDRQENTSDLSWTCRSFNKQGGTSILLRTVRRKTRVVSSMSQIFQGLSKLYSFFFFKLIVRVNTLFIDRTHLHAVLMLLEMSFLTRSRSNCTREDTETTHLYYTGHLLN